MTPDQVSHITYALAALAIGVTITNVGVMFLTAWFVVRTVRTMLETMQHHADGWKRAADAEASKLAMAADYVHGVERITSAVVEQFGRLAPRVGELSVEVDILIKSVQSMGLKVESVIEQSGASRTEKSKGAGHA